MRGSCCEKSIDAHWSPSSGKNSDRIRGPSSGSRAGICCKLGLDIEIRPETVPPSPSRIWLIFPCMRPSGPTCFKIDAMKVPWILFKVRASTTSLGSSCVCSARKPFVNEGAPSSVRGYGTESLSKAAERLVAAQISTGEPTSSLMRFLTWFSRFIRPTFARSAASRSTRTPRHVISTRQGISFSSRSTMSCKPSCPTLTRKKFHSSKVSSASTCAYGPTNIAGIFHISAFGSRPNSRAASTRPFSDLTLSR